jgi:hypothetical protein
MSYWVYSIEALPNPQLLGKHGYNPECFMWNGIRLPLQPGWQKFPETFFTVHRQSWRDKLKREVVSMVDSTDDDGRGIKGLATMLEERFGSRGVAVFSREPSALDKERIEEQCRKDNLAFRMLMIENYENRLEQRKVGEIVPTAVTPYEDQCYEILGLVKPYSVEAKRAQRHPGEAVGEQLVAALERLLARREQQHQPEVAAPAA